LEAAF